VGNRGLLAQGDQRFDNTTQLLGFRQRGLDDFMLQERVRHVTEHRLTVTAAAIQLAKAVTVTHFSTSFNRLSPQPSFSSPAGGQFSSFIPSVRPRVANTSLI